MLRLVFRLWGREESIFSGCLVGRKKEKKRVVVPRFLPKMGRKLKGKLNVFEEDQNTHVQVHMGLSDVLSVWHFFFSPSIFSLFPLYYVLFCFSFFGYIKNKFKKNLFVFTFFPLFFYSVFLYFSLSIYTYKTETFETPTIFHVTII